MRRCQSVQFRRDATDRRRHRHNQAKMSLFKAKTVKRTIMKLFSEKTDIKLINLVKANPVLYNYNDSKYVDLNAREVAWQKVGDELGKPPTDCKVRWINIRDVHRRILRRNMSGICRPSRPYKYDKQLDFMKDFYKEVVSGNTSDENDEHNGHRNDNENDNDMSENWNDVIVECNNDSEEDSKPLKQKRARKMKVRKIEEVEVINTSMANETLTYVDSNYDVSDPVDAFLLSIGATLKKFSPYHLNLAKSKIFHIVQEHDLQQIVEKQPSCGVSTSTEPVYYQG